LFYEIKKNLEVNIIERKILPSTAQEDYELLISLLGEDKLIKLFSGMILDLNHSGVRAVISPLAMLYRVAERYNIQDKFLRELNSMSSIVVRSKYGEFTQRYLTLLIAEKEFPKIKTALPEHKVLGESNPDWTLRIDNDYEFYLEVTAISTQKTIDDLNAFGGRIPTSKIINSYPEPLYFEIVFPNNPRNYEPQLVGKSIINIVKTKTLPKAVNENGLDIFVDLLATRYQLPQIIRPALNSIHYMKSTRLMGGKLAYTLSTEISLKTIENKIDEKKKSNALKTIGNAWICIFVDGTKLEDILENKILMDRLQKRISQSTWLKGIIIVNTYNDTEGNWRLSYFRVD
jgi:hypothetical protein